MTACLFCRIVAAEIPAAVVYQDELVMVFKDIHPKAPVHLLMIPKKHIDSLQQLQPEDQALMGHMMLLLPKIAAEQGLEEGFKTQIHTGVAGGQEVFHLHLHLLGRP